MNGTITNYISDSLYSGFAVAVMPQGSYFVKENRMDFCIRFYKNVQRN